MLIDYCQVQCWNWLNPGFACIGGGGGKGLRGWSASASSFDFNPSLLVSHTSHIDRSLHTVSVKNGTYNIFTTHLTNVIVRFSSHYVHDPQNCL